MIVRNSFELSLGRRNKVSAFMSSAGTMVLLFSVPSHYPWCWAGYTLLSCISFMRSTLILGRYGSLCFGKRLLVQRESFRLVSSKGADEFKRFMRSVFCYVVSWTLITPLPCEHSSRVLFRITTGTSHTGFKRVGTVSPARSLRSRGSAPSS